MANEDTRAEDALERLRTQKEIIELKAQIAELRAPWWRKAGWVAGITALAATILPITTAVQEHYHNKRDLRLQQSRHENELELAKARQEFDIKLERARQENEFRMAYMDRFDVPGHRLQTLRFLLATSDDPRLLDWAKKEQTIVQAQVDKIEADLAAVQEKIMKTPPGQALEELKKEREELSDLRDKTVRRPKPAATAQ